MSQDELNRLRAENARLLAERQSQLESFAEIHAKFMKNQSKLLAEIARLQAMVVRQQR